MRLHEELWMAAVPLRDAKDLADPEALARVLYADELPAA